MSLSYKPKQPIYNPLKITTSDLSSVPNNFNGPNLSIDSLNNYHLNISSNDHEINIRRYNEGSVYRQATRFNPFLSYSTNISSSVSGSVEVIISDLDEHLESQNKEDLSPLCETSNENSDEQDTAMIKNIINQKKNLICVKEKPQNLQFLDKTMAQLQKIQEIEKMTKEKSIHKLKLQILRALNNK